MGTVNKKVLLDSLEQRIELHLEEALSNFQNLSTEVLLQPSSEGGWSIAQCLWHLNSYGDYYLPHIKKAIKKEKGNPQKDSFKSSWIGSYFTKMMEPESSKKKLKAFKGHIPPKKLDAHAVVAEFIRQQEVLLKFIRQAEHKDLDALKLPISISKFVKLKLGDVFQFLIAHNERHLQQAKRNLHKT